jgi:polyphosphate kinase
LAIYSSNLDEFYRIRVASYRSLVSIPEKTLKNLKYSPEKILNDIKKEVEKQQTEYENIFTEQIIPELEKCGIILYQNCELSEEHQVFLKNFFMREVLPYIQPVLLTQGDVLSFLQDNVIYLSVKMFKKSKKINGGKRKSPTYAIIKIPTGHLPRFVELPKFGDKSLIFFLEDIIRHNLSILFPGFEVEDSYCIKVSRDADLLIEDEFSGNILEKLKKSLSKRKTGTPARFLYDRRTPADVLKTLKKAFNLAENDFVEGGRYHNFDDFFAFPNPKSPKFELPPLKQIRHTVLERYNSIIQAVKENDILLHFPYHSFDYVLRFFSEAAVDPKVEEIKTTQYRVATNSAIVNSLITAARNNKKVTVFVEIKARFDEEMNIHMASKMKAAGIHVIESMPGLKVHAKSALVIRKSTTQPTKKRYFAFVSTGNFNEKTAMQYSDHGFFTSNEKITDDLVKLFRYFEHPEEKFKFSNILVPNFNMNTDLKKKIDREIKHAKEGKFSHIILKMNSLEETDMIEKLYEAGSKGVKIDLLIRGICCLRPNMPFSKNIRVIRIVDRFLEHSRIFAFNNNSRWEVYISSADLMNRNLHRRVECAAPILDTKLKKELIDFLQIQLADNTSARLLDENINHIEIPVKADEKTFRAQIDTYLYLEKKFLMGN